QEMDEDARPLEVAKEPQAEPLPLGRPRDEAGNVGDDEVACVVHAGEPQGRREGREGVLGDLRPRRRETRPERCLPRVREADDADVGEEPELEPEPARLAWPPGIR